MKLTVYLKTFYGKTNAKKYSLAVLEQNQLDGRLGYPYSADFNEALRYCVLSRLICGKKAGVIP